MNARAARLAAGLAGLGVLLLTIGLVLGLSGPGIDANRIVTPIAFLAVYSAVGIAVASHQPRNPIGWIFCLLAVDVGLSALFNAYADYWLDGNGARWLGEAAAAYQSAGWIPGVLIPATFVPLLFPDGRPLSRRWRWVAWAAGIGIAGALATELVRPGVLDDFPGVRNALGVESPVRDAAEGLSALLILIALVGSPLSLVLRFRRSAPRQREQIKWMAWAGAIAVVTFVVGATAGYAFAGEAVTNAAILASILALPLAAGIAILRYRLYDIDVVINRTLVYGALTATLAGAYLVCVLLFQLALSPLTSTSDLAVAGSTLVVAAAFRPARAWIQALVDRRFFRQRYDAARTLEGFSARLRDEVELEALSSELRTVVEETMQPAHVSLWLRAPEAGG